MDQIPGGAAGFGGSVPRVREPGHDRIWLALEGGPDESAAERMNRYLPYYKHLWTVRWHFALGVFAGFVFAVASGLGMPLMMGVVFPMLFNTQNVGNQWYVKWITGMLGDVSRERLLLITCLWIPLIFLIRSISAYANSYFIQYAGHRVLEDIRLELFQKLQTLPLSFFKKNRSGDLLARLMNDTSVLRQVVANVSSDLIKQPATLVGALGYLGYMAWKEQSTFSAIIALITVPICVFVIRLAGKKLTRRARSLQEQGGTMTAALSETLQAPLEIRAYNLEERQISVFRRRTNQMLRVTMKVAKYRQAIAPSIELVAATGVAAALYWGVKEGMSHNAFMGLITALFVCYEPIKKLGLIHSLIKQGDAALERINFIAMEPDTLPDPESPVPFRAPEREICFEDLVFAYGEEPVLKGLNLRIPIGQVVALVGPSGAGKSTFAHLIPRFYDPQTGGITFDGVDVRRFRKKDLRDAIAVVPQMPSLFLGTIAENIRIGRETASDEEVVEAARRANADEFIRSLPEGYQTEVGERGDLLSGGQRQRIAIARAFLKDAPILILDEATSALDSESEAMIQQALAALVKGRTTFIIAHRYSTITIADRVLVFQQGRIVADGNHETLRATDPTYQSMLGSQFSGVEIRGVGAEK
jgi:subfamily B ATP-binding cassette protein MsbA